MSSLSRVAVLLAFTSLVHPALARAQSQERTIYASVLDRSGAPLTGLTAADFGVREDGLQREVLTARPATDPIRIAVLVDTSRAMEPYIKDLRNGLTAFFHSMEGRGEIALYGFGERPTRLVDYTRDMARLEAGIGRVFSESMSASYLLDAIIEVSRDLHGRDGVRSAIVVVTAEGPEFSHRDYRTVLDEVKAAGPTLHSLVLTRRSFNPFNDGAREREFTIANGAELTGGRREDLFTSTALPGRLEALADELKNQYELVYARPRTLIGAEKVEVSVNRTDATVRAPRMSTKVSTD